MNRLLPGVLCFLFPMLGFAEGQPNGAAESGIQGAIVISPIRGGPVRQGAATSQPLADVAFDVKQEGRVVTSFQTDANGEFKVKLPPGHYSITRQQKVAAVGSYGPFEVDVSSGKMATVHWECDSGLR